MEVENIPNAEELFLKITGLTEKDKESIYTKDCVKAMVKFAKIHVKEALKIAAKEASISRYFPDEKDRPNTKDDNLEGDYVSPYIDDSNCSIVINIQSIIDAYSLTLIK